MEQILVKNIISQETPAIDIRCKAPTVDLALGASSAVAALTAASAAGGPVLIPAGTYLIDDDVTCSAPLIFAGGKFSIASGKTLTINGPVQTVPAQLFEGSGTVAFGQGAISTVLPQWWGARGDGVQDDAPAFRSAVDSIESVGGRIFVPAGLYRLASCDTNEITKDERCAFILKDNMKVIGEGGTKLWLDGATLKDVAPFNAGSRFSFIGVLQGAVNCEIGHLEFTSNGWVLDIAFRSYNAVACMGDHFWIHDLYMKDLPGRNHIRAGSRNENYPAYVHVAKHGVIERITCINGSGNISGNTVANDCSFFYLDAEHLDIRDVVLYNEAPSTMNCGGIELHGENMTVRDSFFKNLWPGIYSGKTYLTPGGGVAGETIGNKILHNRFERCTGGVQLIAPATGMVIEGNDFLDCGLSSDAGLPIHASWNSGTSLGVGPLKNICVQDNRLQFTTPDIRAGILLPNVQGGMISGNIISGRASAIQITSGLDAGGGTWNVVIRDNLLYNTPNPPAYSVYMIQVSAAATVTCANVEIYGNVFLPSVATKAFLLGIYGALTNINSYNNRMVLGTDGMTGGGTGLNHRPGVYTKNGATASVADGGTITHGLGATPTVVTAVGSVAGEIVSVTAKSSTTFTVAIKKHDGTAGTSQTIYWTVWV